MHFNKWISKISRKLSNINKCKLEWRNKLVIFIFRELTFQSNLKYLQDIIFFRYIAGIIFKSPIKNCIIYGTSRIFKILYIF